MITTVFLHLAEATVHLKSHFESSNGPFCTFETVKLRLLHHFKKVTELLVSS